MPMNPFCRTNAFSFGQYFVASSGWGREVVFFTFIWPGKSYWDSGLVRRWVQLFGIPCIYNSAVWRLLMAPSPQDSSCLELHWDTWQKETEKEIGAGQTERIMKDWKEERREEEVGEENKVYKWQSGNEERQIDGNADLGRLNMFWWKANRTEKETCLLKLELFSRVAEVMSLPYTTLLSSLMSTIVSHVY